MSPLNDNLKIEVSVDEYGFGGADEKEGVESGIVVELPDQLNYLGFHSFAFEDSLMNKDLDKLLGSYKKLIGKRVYWSAFQERGSVIKEGKRSYAFLKLTDLIAVGDSDSTAHSVSIKNGGAFSV